MEYWEKIDLKPSEQAWERTTVHMSHFIKKMYEENSVHNNDSTSMRTCFHQPLPLLWYCPRNYTPSVSMQPWGQFQQMDSISRRIAKMAREAEHGPRHFDFFRQGTPIYHRRGRWPATMPKPKSTLLHPSHRPSVSLTCFIRAGPYLEPFLQLQLRSF